MSKIGHFFNFFSVQAGVERTATRLARRLEAKEPNVTPGRLKELAADAREQAKLPRNDDANVYRYRAMAYDLLASKLQAGQSIFQGAAKK